MTAMGANVPQTNMLAAALAYAARGWRVFPLAAKTKNPLIAKRDGGNGCHDATTDAEQIRMWWTKAPSANIGIATGHSFWVLDIDPDGMSWLESNELAATHEAVTGRGGKHLFYSIPEDGEIRNSTGKIAPGVDVRGVGGYVMVAPSIHPNGTSYTWLDCEGDLPEGPISDAPLWLLDLAKKTGDSDGRKFTLPEAILEGKRDDTLYKLAASMRSHDFDFSAIRAAIEQANQRCVPPLPSTDLDRIAKSVCTKPAGKSARFKTKLPDPSNADVPGDIRGLVLVSAMAPSPEPTAQQSSKRDSRNPEFLWTDSGHANRLAWIYSNDLRYCEDRRMFFVWAGTRWKLDKELHVQRLVEKMLLALYNDVADEVDESKRKAMLASIKKSLSQGSIRAIVDASRRNVVSIGPADFDLNPYLLNFNNGTLDLRTGEFRAHRREDLITKCIPYNYDPKAKAPTFYQFLSRIMGDHPEATPQESERACRLIAYLKRAFGCAAIGIPVKIIFIFYGSGNNGKTTLIEFIRAVLGDEEYAGQIQIESLMVRPSEASGSNAINADLADLQGCRFVTASEPEKGMRFSVARVKYLTGLGKIKARYLQENPFTFEPSHTLFIDCNDKPVVSDPHETIWNRIKALPFTVTIPDEEIDTMLPDKLRAEIAGTAVWLAEGAREYIQHGLPDIPEVTAATEEYQAESDKLRDFIFDRCEMKPGNYCASTDVYTAYVRWATANDERFPVSRKTFKELMEKRGCPEKPRESGKIRALVGVALKDPESDKVTGSDKKTSYIS